jgi:hypothetical protein
MFVVYNTMNNNTVQKTGIPSNYTFEKNNETYNKHIFERNMQTSNYVSRPNQNPQYFNEQHFSNRNDAEVLFQKRFASFEKTQPKGGKMGYVNFADNNISNQPKSIDNYQFEGNYKDYMTLSDMGIHHSSFTQGEKNKGGYSSHQNIE